jgi:CAAX prenyl protease-like protein
MDRDYTDAIMLTDWKSSPTAARIVPFAVFALLTIFQGTFGEQAQYWIYAAKTVVGAWLLWSVRREVREMRWAFSWEAVVVGVVVFATWVGLDGLYPLLSGRAATFHPAHAFGSRSAGAWFFVAVRIFGSSIVVPPLEEVFYRSFMYRYIIQTDFLSVPLGRFNGKAFLIAGAIFGLGHFEWLPGILCAFAYQGLVIRKDRLGDAMSAHAITNFLLGIWVVTRGAWQFW